VAEIIRREVPAPHDSSDRDAALHAFETLMNGALGGAVASLIGEAQESGETRAIVIDLLAPYRHAGDAALGAILVRRLLGT
jgi:hypothetical protein